MDAELQSIRAISEQWTAAVSQGDVAALRELMVADIVVVHGNGRVLHGKEAVAGDLARGLAEACVEQRLHPDETVVAGEWAFDRATVHTVVAPRAGGEPRQFDSITFTILRRDADRRWRAARVIGVIQQSATTGGRS